MKITKKLNSATLAFLALGLLAQVNAVEPQDVQPQDMQPQKNPEKLFSARVKEYMIELAKKELDKGFLTPEVASNNRQKLDQFQQDPDAKVADLNQKLIGLKQQVAIIEKLENGINRQFRQRVPREISKGAYLKEPKVIDVVKHPNYIDLRVDYGHGDVQSVWLLSDKKALDKEAMWTVFTTTKEMKSKSIDEFPQFLESIKSNDDTKKLIGQYSLKQLGNILDDCRDEFNQEIGAFIKKHTNKPGKYAPADGYEPLTPVSNDGYGQYVLAQDK